MSTYTITADVRRKLEASFVEERDLVDGIREQRAIQEPGDPGVFGAAFLMTVRRPMDLETAELRRIRVKMRAAGETLEVFEVEGLPSP